MREHGLLYMEELRLRDEGGTQYWVVFPSEGHILLCLQAGHEHAVTVAWTRPACSERLG